MIGDHDTAREIARTIQTRQAQETAAAQKYQPGGQVWTALSQFADSATLGGSKYLSALVRSKAHGMSFTDALHEVDRERQADYEANPGSAWTGWGAGLVAGGGLLNLAGKGLRALGVAEKFNPLAFEEGMRLRNVGKMAVTGGSIAATQARIEGGDPALAGAVGAVGGAVAGGVAAKVGDVVGAWAGTKLAARAERNKLIGLPGFQMTAQAIDERFSAAAWRRVANIIGEDVSTLKAAALEHKRITGRDATLVDLLNYAQQDRLHAMARKAPTVANALREAHALKEMEQPTALRSAIERIFGKVENVADWAMAQEARMNAAMSAIRDVRVPLTQADLEGIVVPAVRSALRKNDPLLDALDRAALMAERTGSTYALTVGNLESIRRVAQNLREAAKTVEEGQRFRQLRDTVVDLVSAAEPRYAQALDAYRRDAIRIQGFELGAALKRPGDITDTNILRRLATPEGQEGYRAGLIAGLHRAAGQSSDTAAATARRIIEDANLRQLMDSAMAPAEAGALREVSQYMLRNIERSARVVPPRATERPTIERGELGHMIGAAGSGLLSSVMSMVYHATRAVARLELPMSPPVQRRVAEYLTNPDTVPQAVAILKRAGATREQIREVMRMVGTAQAGPTPGVVVSGTQ